MRTTTPALAPAAAAALETWHAAVAARDLSALPEILHPDAVFRSPVAYRPYRSAAAVELILRTVITVFEDFTYHREFVGDDGQSVVLEFSATVDGKSLTGIDMIRFDEAGLITELEVMVRPLNGLQALGARMAQALAAALPPDTS